ncbi:hypothetical protein KJ940_07385 [Myxococcota bacterium]|nr:hypothetical protein [Myxococcota bacterium]
MIDQIPLLGLTLLLAAPPPAPIPRPGAGESEAVIEVQGFGRYAIQAQSPRGATVRLLDRMTGLSAPAGEVGRVDGRLDVFLERGEYKIVTQGPADEQGQTLLHVRPFSERGADQALVEGQPLTTALDDLESLSYWLELPLPKRVTLEAAGRNLETLRLWRDGAWLDPNTPQCAVISPTPTQPLKRCRFSAQLPAGLYRLSLYGGPSQPWTTASDAHPLHLRWGIPRLGAEGYSAQVISAFGEDLFIAPSGADRFELWLSQPAPIAFKVERLWNQPFGDPERALSALSPQARVPTLSLYEGSDAERLVTVQGQPGQGYRLWRYEEAYTQGALSRDGDFFFSLIPAAPLADVIDVTLLLWQQTEAGAKEIAAQLIEIGPGRAYQGRFNVEGEVSLLIDVLARGSYPFYAEGARFQLKPLVMDEEAPFELAPFAEKRLEELEAGRYVLTLKSDAPQAVALRIGLGAPTPTRGVAQIPQLHLEGGTSLYFRAGETGARFAKHLRRLPLDLESALPLVLLPGETIELPIAPKVAGVINALAVEGAAQLSLDGGPWRAEVTAAPGAARLRVRSAAPTSALFSLALTPALQALKAPTTRPEPLVGIKLGAPLAFAVTPNTPYTRKVEIDAPGFYIVESAGLLSVRGQLRTRTRPELATNTGGGPGGNAWLSAFLRPGDYAVTYTPQGRSAGDMSARVRAATLIEAGALVDGRPARVEIPADAVARFTFEIPTAGRWRVEAFGLGQTLLCRVEDEAGWPIGAVDGPCDRALDLKAGRYALLLPAKRVEITAQARISRVLDALTVKGHGPHAVALGASVEALWRESPQREPDVWTFSLPAPDEITLSLGDAMMGQLLDAQGALIAPIHPGQALKRALPMGDYRLEIRARRRDDFRAYTLDLRSEALLAGQTREVEVLKSKTLSVSIGEAGRYVFSSFGQADLMAHLYDAQGALIAHNDDRPLDWNFRLSAQLNPGRYRLEIEDFEEREPWAWRWEAPKEARVELRRVTPRPGPALPPNAPLTAPIADDASSHLFALDGLRPGLIEVEVRGGEALEVALDAQGPRGWAEIAATQGVHVQFKALTTPGAAHRLRVSSMDLRGAPATISWRAVQVPRVEAARLARTPTTADGAYVVTPPGLWRLSRADNVLVCDSLPGACAAPTSTLIYTQGGGLFLLGEGLTAAPVVLAEGEGLKVNAPGPRRLGVAASEGAPRVLIARASGGRPLLAFGPKPTMPGAVSANGALAVDPQGGATEAILWPATGEVATATLRLTPLRALPSRAVALGAVDLNVPPRAALRLTPPRGRLRFELSLSEGLAAEALALHWADGAALHIQGELEGALTLYNPTEAPGRVALSLREALRGECKAPCAAPIAVGRPLAEVLLSAGRYAASIPAAEAGVTLHARGGAARYLRHDGRLFDGDAAPVGPGGVLLIEHAPGSIFAWIEAQPGAGPWPQAEAPPRAITSPTRLELEDAARLQLDVGGPALLHVRAHGTLAARVQTQGGRADTALVNGAFDRWLPTGQAEIHLRALPRGPLGVVDISHSPAVALQEGVGPQALLRPGERRAYTLSLSRPRTIGFGLRADADRVTLEIRRPDGTLIAEGLAQMTALEAGDYILLLHLPPEGRPTRVRPVVLGLTPPEAVPPDVIESYQQQAQGGD